MTPGFDAFVEWDVASWSRAFRHWELVMEANPQFKGKKGLEIGANQGGVSLFFATRFGCPMYCTDLESNEKAIAYHRTYAPSASIQYQKVDVLQMPFATESFDFVVFKSLLGVVGRQDQVKQIECALMEIHRVLKPGGILFFAENLRGSWLHVFARQQFIPWGKNWHYMTYAAMVQRLGLFAKLELHTTGFFAAFARKPEWFKTLIANIDWCLFFIPKTWRYVAFGHAVK